MDRGVRVSQTNLSLALEETWRRHSLLLLLLLHGSPVLHQVTVETGLLSLLLLQVDAGNEASSVQVHLMFLFVTAETRWTPISSRTQ